MLGNLLQNISYIYFGALFTWNRHIVFNTSLFYIFFVNGRWCRSNGSQIL